MEKRFSQMTMNELREEVGRLREEAIKAERQGRVSEFAVAQRKMTMAASYMLDPNEFQPGEVYLLDEEEATFQISYLNGIFAWGYREGNHELEAVPIAILKKQPEA
ncbi:uncharacterized protein DUF1811 [Salsuginibacillus halophilus]|uniref:Uncharacterized protein DUF1811 n=1 Tax=Salsuginibacillus halophilus TaxID=517424 RepID=A0A2P8HBP8_9BACI|nr:YfhH family protein [Salsuginibacillus halophilus]PSL43644.1 uncharacterized protein DUF1811 [Salsuginibacillus halophilus]